VASFADADGDGISLVSVVSDYPKVTVTYDADTGAISGSTAGTYHYLYGQAYTLSSQALWLRRHTAALAAAETDTCHMRRIIVDVQDQQRSSW
jgi:hypothetical protein